VVCVLVGILFIFYGVKIMNVIRMSGAVTADKSANRRKTLKAISSLLGRCCNELNLM